MRSTRVIRQYDKASTNAADAAPNRQQRAAALAAWVWTTVFIAFHVYWFCGGRFGFGDQSDPIPKTDSAGDVVYVVITGGMFLVGLLLPLAVVAQWGRRIPQRLLVTLALLGGALLLLRGASGLVDDVLRTSGIATHGLTGMSNEQVLGDTHPTQYTWWSTVGVDAYFTLGGVLYGLLWLRLAARISPP